MEAPKRYAIVMSGGSFNGIPVGGSRTYEARMSGGLWLKINADNQADADVRAASIANEFWQRAEKASELF